MLGCGTKTMNKTDKLGISKIQVFHFGLFLFCFFLEREFCYIVKAVLEISIAQAGLKLISVLLAQPPDSWDYRHV